MFNDMEGLETQAEACRLIYQAGGLLSALLAIQNICNENHLPVDRINALYVPADLSMVINVSDTLQIAPSSPRRTGEEPPVFLWRRLREIVMISDLNEYKARSIQANPALVGAPFTKYRSLVRIPLCKPREYVFVLNFWSLSSDAFKDKDLDTLIALTRPLGEAVSTSQVVGLPTHSPVSHPRTSQEKLEHCPGLAKLLRLVKQVAPTDSTVLIMGETGSGKESVADSIHELSPRKGGPLLKVNCGAIAETLLDSELFGHEKGAFTGAGATRKGYFEAANGGTLVLDEIGEMTLSAQVRLLRVLESGCVTRVGGTDPTPLDVRVVASTHADLRSRVAEGKFRKDLWYRLSVFPIVVPPLRHRKEDIPHLVKHFLRKKADELKLPSHFNVTDKEMIPLFKHEWPGNVRELENVVERALIMSSSRHGKLVFDIDTLSSQPGTTAIYEDWPTLKVMEDRYVKAALQHCGGKLTGAGGAAELLGIHYTTLRSYMLKNGLPLPRSRNKGEYEADSNNY